MLVERCDAKVFDYQALVEQLVQPLAGAPPWKEPHPALAIDKHVTLLRHRTRPPRLLPSKELEKS